MHSDFAETVVYDYHILLRSWLTISKRTTISIPQDVDSLIDAVYGKHEFQMNYLNHLCGVGREQEETT